MDPQALIQSTSSLNNISRSFNGLAAGITRSSFLAKSIVKTVKADNIGKKKLIVSDGTFFKRRRESFLRKKREDQIEAGTVNGAIKARGNSIRDTGKGILGRILNFLGLVLIGFVVTKLPQILKGITGVIKRINQVVQIFTGFINGVIGIFQGMSAKLDQVLGMVRFFDFNKQKDGAEEAFQNVNDKLNKLNTNFILGVNRYQDDRDLDEEIKRIEEESQMKPRLFGGTDDPGASNQWWDFLDMFPNKNKTEGENNEDGEKDEIKEEVKEEVKELFEGGELKAGETALVGEGPDGKGKDRELFVPKQDGIVLPNDVTEKLLGVSSLLKSKKDEFDLEPTEGYANIEGMFSGFGVDSVKSSNTESLDISSMLNNLNFGEDLQGKVDEMVGSQQTQNFMSSLKGISKSLVPEMESIANELKDTIDTPEVENIINSMKKNMEDVVQELTPERKGQKIMMPPPPGLGAQPQLKNTSQGTGNVPKAGVAGGGVNIKEYHKHITTLITAYT